jgi:hypothetical protein
MEILSSAAATQILKQGADEMSDVVSPFPTHHFNTVPVYYR